MHSSLIYITPSSVTADQELTSSCFVVLPWAMLAGTTRVGSVGAMSESEKKERDGTEGEKEGEILLLLLLFFCLKSMQSLTAL